MTPRGPLEGQHSPLDPPAPPDSLGPTAQQQERDATPSPVAAGARIVHPGRVEAGSAARSGQSTQCPGRLDSAPPVTVVVLAGGTSRRFGGAHDDKLDAPLGDRSVLDTTLASLPESWPVIVVGPPRAVSREHVIWVREDPPLGGPVAALARAHDVITDGWVAVVAGDTPRGGHALPGLLDAALAAGVTHMSDAAGASDGEYAGDSPRIDGAARAPDLEGTTSTPGSECTADSPRVTGAAGTPDIEGTTSDSDSVGTAGPPRIDGAVAVVDGRRQPLLAVYRADALAASCRAIGDPAGASMRALLAPLDLVEIEVAADDAHDVDTLDDLAFHRARGAS